MILPSVAYFFSCTMGKPKETSGTKQKTLFSFFGPGQGPSKLSSSSPIGVAQSEPKKPAPAAPKLAEKLQVDAKTTEPNKDGVQPPVTNGGSRSRDVMVSSITSKNTPQASDIVMCDDDDEVEEEYRPVSIVAGPHMACADRHTQSRLKRKLVIDSETETENSPAFKKKSAASSSSSPTHNKKRKNRGPRSPIPVHNIL